MAEIKVDSYRQAAAGVRKTAKRFGRNVRMAAYGAARQTVPQVRKNMPVAFGELRKSVHAERGKAKAKTAARVVADAPHAAPVETGSRPHWPPLEPLVRWVKLRGMQGLTSRGNLRKKFGNLAGTTTAGHAQAVAGQIKAGERGGAVSLNVPRQIAFLIARAISRRGTRPHFYMRRALPFCRQKLRVNVETAKTKTSQEAAGAGGSDG